MRKMDVVRFWSRVDVGRSHQCWLWRDTTDEDGYGNFRIPGRDPYHRRQVRAHRAAWSLWHDTQPTQMILHHCDTPACCNPHHLFQGTVRDNNRDRAAKGRSADCRNAQGPNCKLTAEQVREVRRRRRKGELLRVLGEEFGISEGAVSMVCRRISYSDIE